MDVSKLKEVKQSSITYTFYSIVDVVPRVRVEKYSVMQWQTQDINITTNIKVKVDFTLPALSLTNVVTWKCHMDDSAKGRYDMILGRDL